MCRIAVCRIILMYLIMKTSYFLKAFVGVHEVKLLIKISLSVENLLTLSTEHWCYEHGQAKGILKDPGRG